MANVRDIETHLTLQDSEVMARLSTSVHTFEPVDDGGRCERLIRIIGVRIVFGAVLDEDEPGVG